VCVLAGLLLAGLPLGAAAQAGASGEGWQLPRTEWGHPDLQGNWTNATMTPFERRPGSEPMYSWAQVDSIEGAVQRQIEEGHDPSDPDRPPPTAGNVGGYNQVYFDRGDRVARVDGEPRTSLVTFPYDGHIPAMTPTGQARLQEYRDFRAQFGASDHPELRTLSDQCLTSFGSNAGPPMLPNNFYNNNYTIVQTQDHILILAEMVHDVRIFRLGEPDPLPDDVRPWFGDSWGRWEGNTLVVETTNFSERQLFNEEFSLRLHSPTAKVIERFTRVDEGTVLYEFEFDDPETYTERWGGQVPMLRFDDFLYEYACHEGNYALEGILRGARYEESQAAEPETTPGND
jgi:hypothetical protein